MNHRPRRIGRHSVNMDLRTSAVQRTPCRDFRIEQLFCLGAGNRLQRIFRMDRKDGSCNGKFRHIEVPQIFRQPVRDRHGKLSGGKLPYDFSLRHFPDGDDLICRTLEIFEVGGEMIETCKLQFRGGKRACKQCHKKKESFFHTTAILRFAGFTRLRNLL